MTKCMSWNKECSRNGIEEGGDEGCENLDCWEPDCHEPPMTKVYCHCGELLGEFDPMDDNGGVYMKCQKCNWVGAIHNALLEGEKVTAHKTRYEVPEQCKEEK